MSTVTKSKSEVNISTAPAYQNRCKELSVNPRSLPTRAASTNTFKPSPADSARSVPSAETPAAFEQYLADYQEKLKTIAEAEEAIALVSVPRSFTPQPGSNGLFDQLADELKSFSDERDRIAALSLAKQRIETLRGEIENLKPKLDLLAIRADSFELNAIARPYFEEIAEQLEALQATAERGAAAMKAAGASAHQTQFGYLTNDGVGADFYMILPRVVLGDRSSGIKNPDVKRS